MIVNFVDEDGNVLVIKAESFPQAYLKACAQGFQIYDWDIEEEGI